MLVHQILRSKSEKGVITIRPDLTLGEAADLLAAHRIGAVMVSDDGVTPIGILSERDIIRELSRLGGGALMRLVSEAMTRKLVTCEGSDTIERVMENMTEGRFRHMPVVADGQMVGLVSIGDIVKGRLSELKVEAEALEGMIMGH